MASRTSRPEGPPAHAATRGAGTHGTAGGAASDASRRTASSGARAGRSSAAREAPDASGERAAASPEHDRLVALCAAALRERALLLDPERVAAHLRRRRHGARRGAPPVVGAALAAGLDAALRRLEAEDRSAERRAARHDALEGAHALLVQAFGIPPERARAAALAFNALARESREAFFACVVAGRTPAPDRRTAARVRRALQALFQAPGPRAGRPSGGRDTPQDRG